MIITNYKYTPQAIDLADSNNIRLIERTKVENLIDRDL